MKRCIWFGCAIAWIACNGDTLSVGELRCEGTHCEEPEHLGVLVDGIDTEQLPEVDASFAWRTPSPSCRHDGCSFSYTQGRRRARWTVHADGSVTVARSFSVHPSDEAQAPRTGVHVFHLAEDGSLRWQHELSEPREDSSVGFGGAVALTVDGEGQPLIAIGSLEAQGTLVVYRIDADEVAGSAELHELFRTSEGTQPEALALVGDDLWIAGYHDHNPELSRYHLDGELVWRQAVLRPHQEDDGSGVRITGTGLFREFVSGMQLAVDADGRAVVALPTQISYGWAHVDDAGELESFSDVSWEMPMTPEYKAQVAFDRDGRRMIGIDGYAVQRCDSPECRNGEGVLTRRTRDAYYEPELFGLDVDAESRVCVMTQDGVRDGRRLLLDRISADFAQRETFVLDEGDEPDLRPEEIRIGPSGDVYYWALDEVGRITLP